MNDDAIRTDTFQSCTCQHSWCMIRRATCDSGFDGGCLAAEVEFTPFLFRFLPCSHSQHSTLFCASSRVARS